MPFHALQTVKVEDYESWSKGFERGVPKRKEFNSLQSTVLHDPAKPNEVVIYGVWNSKEDFDKFYSNPEIAAIIKASKAELVSSQFFSQGSTFDH